VTEFWMTSVKEVGTRQIKVFKGVLEIYFDY